MGVVEPGQDEAALSVDDVGGRAAPAVRVTIGADGGDAHAVNCHRRWRTRGLRARIRTQRKCATWTPTGEYAAAAHHDVCRGTSRVQALLPDAEERLDLVSEPVDLDGCSLSRVPQVRRH